MAARAGASEGLWICAKRQNAGRGRHGRDWRSPSGNFHGSTLVRLLPTDPPPASLAFLVSVVLHEVISACVPHQQITLKWPNDLLCKGAKLSGVLLERVDDAVVIGIGVNLVHNPQNLDRLTTSLVALGAPPIAPEDFVAILAEKMAARLEHWRADGPSMLFQQWEKAAHPFGTSLSAVLPDGSTLSGQFAGLDGDGALRLQLANGTHRIIHAADIFLV